MNRYPKSCVAFGLAIWMSTCAGLRGVPVDLVPEDVTNRVADALGLQVCHVAAQFSDLSDRLLLITLADIDSFVTVGVKVSDGSDATTTLRDWDSVLFNEGGGALGSWSVNNPATGQGRPNADGLVLVAQLTGPPGELISGSFDVLSFNDTGPMTVPLSFACAALCAGDADCDDGVVCTLDSCVRGACLHAPDAGRCDDGNACTLDNCDAESSCSHQPLSCGDGNPCTDDSCDPRVGCLNEPNNASCTDLDACTVGDGCVAGVCRPGPPLDCDDGAACSIDTCDFQFGCAYEEDDAACDNGVFCDGAESCHPFVGCLPGSPPCGSFGCNEALQVCTQCAADDDCDDGDPQTTDGCVGGLCNYIPICGAGHSCCAPGSTPGCNNAACCAAVCAAHPLCCSDVWNGFCAGQARAVCGAVCDVSGGFLVVTDKTDAGAQDLGLWVFNVSVNVGDPGDILLGVGFSDISTTAPDGFFQVPAAMGGSNTAPQELFLGFFPQLAYDSFVTINLKSVPSGTLDCTTLDPDFDRVAFNAAGRVVGGWFCNNPASGQGAVNPDTLQVLIAQFAVEQGYSVSGSLSVFINDADTPLGGDFSSPAAEPPCLSDGDCGDGNSCTQDVCDVSNGTCVNMFERPGTPCEADSDVCTVDHCDGQGTCMIGAAVDVGDGDPCTLDTCDPAAGAVHIPVDCEDTNGCTTDFCDGLIGNCVHELVPRAECATDDDCAVSEACVACHCLPRSTPGDDDDDNDSGGRPVPDGDDDDQGDLPPEDDDRLPGDDDDDDL